MSQRNLQTEQRAIGQFRSANGGRMPDLNNPNDRAKVYRLAYPTSVGLPDELKNTVDESLYMSGAAPSSSLLSQTVEGSNLGILKANVDTATADVNKTSQPNEALRILQEAIRTKSGQANQTIGESELFKEAGVTGYGALSSSLAEQGKKLDNDYANFSNAVSQMSGLYKDMATAAMNKYTMAHNSYKEEVDRLQKIQDDLTAHANAIDLIKQQNNAAIALEDYKRQHPGIDEIIKGEQSGFVQNKKGGWVKATDTTFISPSGDTYDVAKYAQLDDGTPNPDHIANMNMAVNQMKQLFPDTNGQMKSEADINKYIQTYYPGSPITAQAIMNASAKYGIDWETIIATMVAETRMGTDGSKGSQQYNFGNVGNTNTLMKSGGSNKMASIQAGVDAVAKTMALPYYKRNQVNATGNDTNLDNTSKSILAATGLSMPAFMFLTQGTSALTRMTASQRLQYMKEAENYVNKKGTDIATFQNQYAALGKTVEANSLRNNQASVAEAELNATIENIKTAATESDFKKLRVLNIADIFAGKETNNPAVAKYLFHLQQLRSEFAMYNAAIGGQIDANGNIREISDGDRAVADSIIKDGFAAGSIDGFAKALEASRNKMQTVLQNSIATQNKAVWKLFGIEDKYNKANQSSSSSNKPSLDSFERK